MEAVPVVNTNQYKSGKYSHPLRFLYKRAVPQYISFQLFHAVDIRSINEIKAPVVMTFEQIPSPDISLEATSDV